MSAFSIQVVLIICVPNNGWFSSFKRLDDGVVFMGNDNACKTIGIGTIQLKNHVAQSKS